MEEKSEKVINKGWMITTGRKNEKRGTKESGCKVLWEETNEK